MNIAFDISILDTPHPTGVEKTCRSLLLALKNLGAGSLPAERIYLIAPYRIPDFLPDLGEPFHPRVLQGARLGPLWRERWVTSFVQEHGVQLVHSPVSAIPLTAPCAKIATIHEIPWLEAGTRGDEGSRLNHRVWTYLDATYADRIVCVSNHTSENLMHLYRAAEQKVRVVHHGVDEHFFEPGPIDVLVPRRCGVRPGRYFLAVGRARAKKNLEAAVRAFRVFLDRTGSDHQLVLAGPPGPITYDALVRAEALGIRDRVHAPGYIREELLPQLYAQADALLFLSFSEGFGIPPLESFAAGTPVIASNRTAIREVVGDAGLTVDPDHPLEVADAMIRLCQDEDLAAELVHRGRVRAHSFTWERAAQAISNLWREVLGQGSKASAH
ncbi:MAG: glycosyltransferase family 4 protein [Planctomycetes bacterium]|nr:glycosyltransferase family 4 protein [Planctomycetota bacterium]